MVVKRQEMIYGTLNNVEIQFGEQGPVQSIRNMGPFSSVMISPPDADSLNFDTIIVTANNGEVQTIKSK
jgi:hypothetical protein